MSVSLVEIKKVFLCRHTFTVVSAVSPLRNCITPNWNWDGTKEGMRRGEKVYTRNWLARYDTTHKKPNNNYNANNQNSNMNVVDMNWERLRAFRLKLKDLIWTSFVMAKPRHDYGKESTSSDAHALYVIVQMAFLSLVRFWFLCVLSACAPSIVSWLEGKSPQNIAGFKNKNQTKSNFSCIVWLAIV